MPESRSTSFERYIVGEAWIFDIGVAQVEHRILSASILEFHILTGSRAGESGEVEFDATNVAPSLWLVSWQEPDESTVVHLEDFAQNTFISRLTTFDRRFIKLAGKMWRKTVV